MKPPKVGRHRYLTDADRDIAAETEAELAANEAEFEAWLNREHPTEAWSVPPMDPYDLLKREGGHL